ncbi:DMT family transporter [Bauldia sp.]|uniref:DMT family transporter n=1 Tax=Bauldia sp. TaxID=2575872 RepID=UPI003BADB075
MVTPSDRQPTRAHPDTGHGIALPFAALLLAALAMATSPIFVRLAEIGPFASAFWRVAGALPLIWLWAAWENRGQANAGIAAFRMSGASLVAGLLFAGDLLVWHLAILKTTVANATFLAMMAPVWVVLGSGLLIGEKVGRAGVVGLLLCVAGAAALVGSSVSFAPDRLEGDLYGIATSVFFGAYFMAIRVARRTAGTGQILFQSSLISALVLIIAAFIAGDSLIPATGGGILALIGLSYFSHAGGQGFLAYALGHLPAAFSSLVTFLGSLVAATLAWLIFAEALSPIQAVGGVLILGGIYIARPNARRS